MVNSDESLNREVNDNENLISLFVEISNLLIREYLIKSSLTLSLSTPFVFRPSKDFQFQKQNKIVNTLENLENNDDLKLTYQDYLISYNEKDYCLRFLLLGD